MLKGNNDFPALAVRERVDILLGTESHSFPHLGIPLE